MDEQLQFEALEAARLLLRAYRETHPAWTNDRTPIDEMVSWLGLEVATFHPDDYPAGTYGFLEEGEDLIWLCRDLSSTLRRFTLTHELGHVVLHRNMHLPVIERIQALLQNAGIDYKGASREEPCFAQDVREEVTGLLFQETAEEMLGIGVAYDPRSQRELAANLFAAELLMPLERVRALYLSHTISPGKLAGLFDVSQAALLNRLAGILTPNAETNQQVKKVAPRGESTKRYDEFQQAAIEAPTPALIVAGPGSGKTSTLIGRAAYLIHDLGVNPERILALTFSRKAAQEMQERLQAVLEEGMTPPMVSTFHAFCAELLRSYGTLVGLRKDFAFVDEAEGYFLLRRLAAELSLHHYQNLNNPTANFPALLSAISRAKDELVTPAKYRELAQQMLSEAGEDEKEIERAEKALEVAEVYAIYQRQLERQGDTDFGGLIMLAVELLEQHADVRAEVQERYQHILVDEFQDINRASGVLLRLLAGEQRRVWVVGDANQAIYGFRGASPANIANFTQDYPDAVVLPLSRNYRSRPDIVKAADAFRCDKLEPEAQKGLVQTAREALEDVYVTLAEAKDEASELEGIVQDMRRKHDREGYDYRDMVVLCRTRTQARKVGRALLRAGLPILERGSLFEQEHIRNLLSVLLLLTDNGDMGILRAARQSDHPFSQSDVEALILSAHVEPAVSENGQNAFKHTVAQRIQRSIAPPNLSFDGKQSLHRLSEILRSLLFTTNSIWPLLAQYLFIESSIGRSLLNSTAPEVEAWRDDYARLLKMARYFDQQQQQVRAQREAETQARGEVHALETSMQEQVKGFLDYLTVLMTLRQEGSNRRESAEEDGESVPDVIRIMTVHASKGLEFPVVYLPYLVNQKFPAQRRGHVAPPPRGLVAGEDDESSAHETGESCLFYVGTTRARDQLVLSYAQQYGKRRAKRSSYVDALVMGLGNDRVRRLLWQYEVASNGEEEEQENFSSQPSEAFIEAMEPKTLHASHIETYQRCPRQYLYSTIYAFPGDAAGYQLFWRATRETLRSIQHRLEELNAGNGGAPLTSEEVQELYTRYWQAEQGHLHPFAPMYERHGHEVAELLRRKLLSSKNTNWQLQQRLTVDVAGKAVEVTIDRVEGEAQEGGEAGTGEGKQVRFVKTGFGRNRSAVNPTTRELLYTHAYRQHHPGKTVSLHFHNMSTGETFDIQLSSKKEQKLYDELEQAIHGMERHEYPAKPDAFTCPGCPFYLICPA
ncbi:MAG TPA: ATP-dependent helicase [Ktedonobacteraceae bacterium]|jgi:superfamily I DNA/RNA helicase|nr:ATP-dependent helicase [Ktedonobacteraceae bacterium]